MGCVRACERERETDRNRKRKREGEGCWEHTRACLHGEDIILFLLYIKLSLRTNNRITN